MTAFSRRPATERLHQRLREWIAQVPPGARLGSEAELLPRFEASRPTFRQAIALLEGEQFVLIRRGNGGGYYSSRPTGAAAIAAAADYCRALRLPREEVIAAWIPIRLETVRLATRDRGARDPDGLADFIAELRRGSDRQFAQTVRRFNALLARLADNRLLSLFFEILHESGNRIDHQDFYRRRPERITAYRREMLALATGIATGDEAIAESASLACIGLNLQWAAEDKGR
jgi:DNA-binding FadR family transcriptional regulator